MTRNVIFLIVVGATLANAQPGYWCPNHPAPDCKDDGTSCKNSCDTFGDPITISGANSFHKTVDLAVDNGKGPVFLTRSFISRPETWSNTNVLGIYLANTTPRPYSGPQTTHQWWNNLFSYVAEAKNGSIVSFVSEAGQVVIFDSTNSDGGVGRWLPFKTVTTNYAAAGDRARTIAGGYSVLREDGRTYEYGLKYDQTSSGSYRLYMLSGIRDGDGTLTATFDYADPSGLGCPREASANSPYLQRMNLTSGHSLNFKWDRADAGTTDRRCFMTGVDYAAPGGSARRVATYTYNDMGSGLRELSSFTNSRDGGEAYYYSSGQFRVDRPVAGPFLVHNFDAGSWPVTSTTSTGNEPAFATVQWGSFSASIVGPVISHTSCRDDTGADYVWVTTPGNDGSAAGAAASLMTTYSSRRDEYRHRKTRHAVGYSCTPSAACASSSSLWRGDAGSAGGGETWIFGPAGFTFNGEACSVAKPSVLLAVRDGVGNIVFTPRVAVDAGMPSPLFLPASRQVGAYWSETSTAPGLSVGIPIGALENEAYSWQIANNGSAKPQTITRTSALDGGSTTTQTLTYATTSGGGLRLASEITSGFTKDAFSTWGTVERFRGTFYRPIPGDAMDRTGDVEGPCWVTGLSATGCDPSQNSTWPVTRFAYHAIGAGSGKNSGRLAMVSTFATDAGTAALETYFSNYTEEGDPMDVREPNSTVSNLFFTYEGRKVKSQSRTVSGATETTTWTYDDDKVAAIAYPEGNYEVFCYRTGSSSVFPQCAGTLTSKLRWKAKTSGLPATAGNWTERVDYTYDSNGYFTDEERYIPGESAPRYKRHINPDLHGRETFSKVGGNSGGQDFRMAAHFDGAHNRDALGPPMNLPPDYCKSGGAESALCWWYRYDRANRLNRANAPGTLSRSCFDYDAVGNIKGVTTGDATGGAAVSCDTSFNAPTLATTGVSSSTAIQYTWDDFGNIVQVKNTGVDDPASSGTRYLYDAQGNVLEKQTAAMGSAYKQRFGYDGLGRLTRADSFQSSDGGVQVLYQLDYDVQTGTPTGTLTNLKGRLSRRIDSYGDTWYSYDEAGRTKAEYRKRANCTTSSRGVLCEPHTLYAWDKNGNLTQVKYPFERRVDYVYGSGGDRDRVIQINSDVFLTAGTATTRKVIDAIAWEPYGGLRAYHIRLLGDVARSVEYFMGTTPETSVGGEGFCGDGVTGPPDGSGRTQGLFVSTAKLALNSTSHVSGNILSQRYTWNEDQISRQRTCLAGTAGYQQDFSYDALQRLTAESGNGTPRYTGDSASSTRVFDSRGNRIDATRDGYNVWDFVYDSTVKDRLNKVGWWYGFLNANDYFVKYEGTHNASGVLTKIEANKPSGGSAKWTMDMTYSTTRALSDVFTTVSVEGQVYEYYYDAFGRRRLKADPFGNKTEFMYDLGHQLLIDQDFPDTTGVSSNLDEYLWLDGRPVVAFRGKVSGMGVHEAEGLASAPTTSCSRAAEGGAVHCGAYHLVSNQQNFVVLALSDYDGKVASFALPDADGQINRPRFVHFGGLGSGHDQRFDVPTSFSKEARFRTVYTGGWTTDWWGTWGGITEMRLTAPDGGVTGITPAGGELRRVTSPWSTAMTGTQNVTWSTVCSSNCASATDMLEWRVWETGGPKFNTRLRFPGQYHDAETDFYENWNRFYDPTTGRYLSSEPILQSPRWQSAQAVRGRQSPAYAYAASNPVANVDPDGLKLVAGWTTRFFDSATQKRFRAALNGLNNPSASCACALGSGGGFKSSPWADRDITVYLDPTVRLWGASGATHPVASSMYLDPRIGSSEAMQSVLAHESGHFRWPYFGHGENADGEYDKKRFDDPADQCNPNFSSAHEKYLKEHPECQCN